MGEAVTGHTFYESELSLVLTQGLAQIDINRGILGLAHHCSLKGNILGKYLVKGF